MYDLGDNANALGDSSSAAGDGSFAYGDYARAEGSGAKTILISPQQGPRVLTNTTSTPNNQPNVGEQTPDYHLILTPTLPTI